MSFTAGAHINSEVGPWHETSCILTCNLGACDPVRVDCHSGCELEKRNGRGGRPVMIAAAAFRVVAFSQPLALQMFTRTRTSAQQKMRTHIWHVGFVCCLL